MCLWRWGEDTYKTGYRIFTIFFSKKLGIDIYLFHYMEGSYIPKHKDPSNGKRMFRFNVEIKRPKAGGEFICPKAIWNWKGRMFLFRADNSYHRVTPIEKGSRWVLSFGILI